MRVRHAVVAVGLAVVLAGVAAALAGVGEELPGPLAGAVRLPERLLARFLPPRVSRQARLRDLTGAEREAAGTLGRRLDGLVVWSSNRSGNHELYLLDLRTQALRRLTSHPHVDFFSRFSPDGRHVAFLRSQREWVSFRDYGAWDVYVVGADGAGERRVARDGYHVQWTADGTALTFLRGTQVIRLDLATGRESVLVDGAATDAIGGGLETPELSPDGRRLALTVRSPRYNGVGVLDLDSRALERLSPGQACQLTWTPRGDLLWVEPGGRGGTQVMTARAGRARAVLVDLPGSYSHEYFPRMANDGRWLVWGAAARGHEHDRADYELFVWDTAAPLTEVVRLTHHPGNDQWPDLFVRRAGRS